MMHRTILANVQSREILATHLGTRVHLTFETTAGHRVEIRGPIEDDYLAQIQPEQQVLFQQDRYGCHHLVRRRPWLSLWPFKKPMALTWLRLAAHRADPF